MLCALGTNDSYLLIYLLTKMVLSVTNARRNSLPANVRFCVTLSTFRRHLKSHLFSLAHPLPINPS